MSTTITPREYEHLVSLYFREQGYAVELTPYSNDFGVDVFASRGDERLAVQAKMFGSTERKVNRDMVLHLHGAKDYFDCTRAVIVTDGRVMNSAATVAKKLGIDILFMNVPVTADASSDLLPEYVRPEAVTPDEDLHSEDYRLNFEELWQSYVMPLAGQTLTASDGRTNNILKADWTGIERVSSSGNRSRINIGIFRKAVERLIATGSISRQQINGEYAKRASSGVALILAQIPMFEFVERPVGLRLRST